MYPQHTGYTMNTSMKITDGTRKALLKIGAEYTIKDGKVRTLEAIVRLLIEEHRRRANQP